MGVPVLFWSLSVCSVSFVLSVTGVSAVLVLSEGIFVDTPAGLLSAFWRCLRYFKPPPSRYSAWVIRPVLIWIKTSLKFLFGRYVFLQLHTPSFAADPAWEVIGVTCC